MLPVIDLDADRPYPPRSTAFTATFWQSLAEGRFVTTTCFACGRASFPPKPFCPHCWSEDVKWRALSGRGKLYSSTVIHAAPAVFAAEAPIPVGIVDLDESLRVATRMLARDGRYPQLDGPVEIVLMRYRDGPLFGARPAALA